LLSPTEIGCATIDDIVIIPPPKPDPTLSPSKTNPILPFHIVFLRTTVSNEHPIKQSGVLGRQLISGVPPLVSFCFMVPGELVYKFKTPDEYLLRKTSDNIDISAVSISDDLFNTKDESFYFKERCNQITSSFKPDFFNEREKTFHSLSLTSPFPPISPSSASNIILETKETEKLLLSSSPTSSLFSTSPFPPTIGPFSSSDTALKVKEPEINYVRLFTEWNKPSAPLSFGLEDAKFHVISKKERWGRVELTFSEDKILVNRINENEKRKKEEGRKKEK
jgi:hypothetical protein